MSGRPPCALHVRMVDSCPSSAGCSAVTLVDGGSAWVEGNGTICSHATFCSDRKRSEIFENELVKTLHVPYTASLDLSVI